jgi:hypothetical protein
MAALAPVESSRSCCQHVRRLRPRMPPATCQPPAAPHAARRRDEPVRDSKGVLRPDSAGAATRRRFTKLLSVGAGTARRWWEAGLRCG